MNKTDDTIIDKWLRLLLSIRRIKSAKDINFPKPYKFIELIPLYKDESFSPEHILLILAKKGYIQLSENEKRFILIKAQLNEQQSFTNLTFVLDQEKVKEYLTPKDNQLSLGF